MGNYCSLSPPTEKIWHGCMMRWSVNRVTKDQQNNDKKLYIICRKSLLLVRWNVCKFWIKCREIAFSINSMANPTKNKIIWFKVCLVVSGWFSGSGVVVGQFPGPSEKLSIKTAAKSKIRGAHAKKDNNEIPWPIKWKSASASGAVLCARFE